MASRHYRTHDPFRRHVHHLRRVNSLHRRRSHGRAVNPFRRTFHQVDLGAKRQQQVVRRAGKVHRHGGAAKPRPVKAKGPRKVHRGYHIHRVAPYRRGYHIHRVAPYRRGYHVHRVKPYRKGYHIHRVAPYRRGYHLSKPVWNKGKRGYRIHRTKPPWNKGKSGTYHIGHKKKR